MKKLIAIAGIAALAACSQGEAPTEEATPEVAEAPATSPVPGGPGTYSVTYSDGTVGTLTTNDDGTYSFASGEVSGTGKVTEVDGKACFDPDEDGQETNCWTNGEVGADGSWTSTSDGGDVVTVAPAAAAAE